MSKDVEVEIYMYYSDPRSLGAYFFFLEIIGEG